MRRMGTVDAGVEAGSVVRLGWCLGGYVLVVYVTHGLVRAYVRFAPLGGASWMGVRRDGGMG